MEARSRTDRAAAVILVIVGFALLLSAAVKLVVVLPEILAETPTTAGFGALWVLTICLPMTVGGLLALASARGLWRSSPLGPSLAFAFVMFAGLACLVSAAGDGNILSAVRGILLEPGSLSLSWPMLGVTGVDGSTYYGYLDDATFWIPGIVALCALLVTFLLVAGWIAGRAGGARSM